MSISVKLTQRPIDEDKSPDFIKLMEIRNGHLVNLRQENDYNELAVELASRTFDESGNYYVKPFTVTAKNTLNDYEGNNGIFN